LGETISTAMAESLGIPQAGVYVSIVMAGAAMNAGVQAGDVITGFNGMPVLDMDQLRADIAALVPGDAVEVRVFRGGDTVVLEMVLLPMVFDRF
jgi:S1-C subfamily serine protease